MKNGSKIKKIAPVLALTTLPLALSAVLGAFVTLKTAKADTDILPPASSDGTYQSSLSNLTNFDITYGVIRPESESVYMYTTIGHTVLDGQGVATINNVELIGSNGGVYNGLYSIDNNDLSMKIIVPTTTDDVVYIRADYNGGAIYLSQDVYNDFFLNFSFFMGDTSASTFNPSSYVVNAKIAKPVEDYIEGDFSLEYDTIVTTGKFYAADYNAKLKDWSYLEKNGYVRSGYILLLDYDIQITIPTSSSPLSSLSIFHDSALYTSDEWEEMQIEAIRAYAPTIYSYFPVKADSIGLDVITDGIADILNTEFIPNFKLWYFLLIGLGVTITGLALKFFLGG